VSRDGRSAASRAVSIFILYLTTSANSIAANAKRKTLSAQDIIDAISSLGFDQFIPDLIQWHNSYRKDKAKKDKLKAKKVAQNHSKEINSQMSLSVDGQHSNEEVSDQEESQDQDDDN